MRALLLFLCAVALVRLAAPMARESTETVTLRSMLRLVLVLAVLGAAGYIGVRP